MNIDNNSAMEMDPSLAKQLFAKGATLIIAGVPIGTEFGIDLCSYKVDGNFRGVKMIPPGPHLVYCAAQAFGFGDVGARVGFSHYFKSSEIVVREWDPGNEELRERQISDPEMEKRRIRENLTYLDRYLAPYDYRYASEWKQLTDTIGETSLEQCRPASGVIRTAMQLQSCPDSERPRGGPPVGLNPHKKIYGQIADEDELLPKLKPIEGTAPRFTVLPPRVPKDLQPADISRHSMDCIEALTALLDTFTNPNELIAEIQLSFVFFLVCHSVESLAHWRKCLNLLSNSEMAITKYQLLYMKYSEVLAHQLPRLPEELLEPTVNNSVYKDVRKLLVNLYLGGLVASAKRLSKKLLKVMHWQFEGLLEDDPEDMPVIVEYGA